MPYIEQLEPGAILDRLDKVARRTYGLSERDSAVVNVNFLTQPAPERDEDYADVREIEASGDAAS